MRRPPSRGVRRNWFRLIPLLVVAGIGAFVLGTRAVPQRPGPNVHPITSRVIPGIATDATWLERLGREREEAPDRALQLLGLTPGMTVADVGAGSGYMTIRMARLVGPTGIVYANDIQPAMLRTIGDKATAEHLLNIRLVQGTEDETGLPATTLDVALLVDVYHELHHAPAILRSIRRALKTGGELAVIEYRKEDSTISIADTHRMSVVEIRTEIEASGFTFDRVIEELPRQHLLIFRRPAS